MLHADRSLVMYTRQKQPVEGLGTENKLKSIDETHRTRNLKQYTDNSLQKYCIILFNTSIMHDMKEVLFSPYLKIRKITVTKGWTWILT